MNATAQDLWYVLVEGQSYGPYTHDVMINFVGEGRLIASSLISQNAQHGYVPANSTPIFQHWANIVMQLRQGTQTAQPQMQQTHTPQAQTPQAYTIAAAQPVQKQDPRPTQSATRPSTVFIVMAEVDPKTGMNFLRALQSFGYVQRIGDSVWLLQGQHELNEVKSALASTLTKRDRLFIHDCFANQQDWVNIGADLDARIAQMWHRQNQ